MRWVALIAILVAAAPARAVDLRLLGGVDLFAVNQPGSVSPAAVELGFGLRADARGLAKVLDLRLDYRDRESFIGNYAGRHQLHNLSLTAHLAGGRVDLVVGRFPTPSGYWLIVDGAGIGARLGPVTLQAYGGLRSFTTGRADATFRGEILPLAGAAVGIEHPVVRAMVAFTWTRDLLEFGRGLTPDDAAKAANCPPWNADQPVCPGWAKEGTTTGAQIVDRGAPDRENQFFLDAQLALFPHKTVALFGGATFSTRYQATFQSGTLAMFTAPPSVGTEALGAFSAYAVADWRPLARLRFSYAFDFNRLRLVIPVQPLDNRVAAAGGSFEDHTFKAGVRIWRALGAEARYRLRFRENTDVVHRFEGGLRGDNLLAGLGAFVTVGGDIYRVDRVPEPRRPQSSVVATGGLSFTRPWLDLRGGVLYTQAIGTGVGFSTHAQRAADAPPTSELFPLVLEAQRIAFLRAFGMWKWLFAGLDVELSIDAKQVRSMVQVGGSY